VEPGGEGLSNFFILPCPPLSLSQKRERRGRGGEYIKGKEFVIYILYIENSFHILYTPLSPLPLSLF